MTNSTKHIVQEQLRLKPDNHYVFHITQSCNLNSILQKGLLPKQNLIYFSTNTLWYNQGLPTLPPSLIIGSIPGKPTPVLAVTREEVNRLIKLLAIIPDVSQCPRIIHEILQQDPWTTYVSNLYKNNASE